MRELLNLFKITGKGTQYIFLLLLRCPFNAIHTIVVASFLQSAFLAISRKSTGDLYMACVVLGLGSLLIFLYNGTVRAVYAPFIVRLISMLRYKLFGHISGISLQQMESKSSGEWFTRLNADVQSTSAILSQPVHIPDVFASLINLCVSSAMLFMFESKILILVMVFTIPHILVNQLYIAKPMTAFGVKSLETAAQNTTDMNAIITCADVAILYEAQNFLLHRFEKSSLDLRKANMRIRRRNAFGNALLPLSDMSGYLTLLFLGSVWISSGKITFGELAASFHYRGGVIMGFMLFINSLLSIKTALAGVRRVNETMLIPSEE